MYWQKTRQLPRYVLIEQNLKAAPLKELISLAWAGLSKLTLCETPHCRCEIPQRKLNPLCAFTSCRGVTEFNSTRCAHVLLDAGTDVNARADRNENGLGGHTPIFHAVNSIFNYCRPVMEILVNAGADLDTRVRSLLWGDSMSWETVVYDVTPISYAQCGLYRQFHRREEDVYSNIAYLHRKRFGNEPTTRNVPNKYLAAGH